MLSEANRTLDLPGRNEKLARVAARVMHEMPIIPLAFPQAHHLHKPYVHALDTGWQP
jgi:ABC-type oligopeptide transport system substrate-binding subunit